MDKRKPWGFCETPEAKCTMNYCDENGCQNRKRTPTEFVDKSIEQRAKEEYKKHSKDDERLTLDEQIQRSGGFIVGFKEGYKACQQNLEVSERLYTKEEMRLCWFEASEKYGSLNILFEEYIESLPKSNS
jgi:hypothetical protein